MNHNAIYSLYPQVAWIDDALGPHDKDNNKVEIDEAAVAAEAVRLEAIEAVKRIEANRAFAYTAEADPLFFKYQAGEVTKKEWLAKREEIRSRYPNPSKTQ